MIIGLLGVLREIRYKSNECGVRVEYIFYKWYGLFLLLFFVEGFWRMGLLFLDFIDFLVGLIFFTLSRGFWFRFLIVRFFGVAFVVYYRFGFFNSF